MPWTLRLSARFIVALWTVGSCAEMAHALDSSSDLEKLYQQALDSPIVLPASGHSLRKINQNGQSPPLVHFGNKSPFTSAGDQLEDDTWIAISEELQLRCRGLVDPVIALQQILGMPPRREGGWRIFHFQLLHASDLFRPCLSGTDTEMDSCSATQLGSNLNTDDARFVINNFRAAHMSISGQERFPFTGLGWTYDWNPASADHVGVSEFIGHRGAPVTSQQPTGDDPAKFCQSS
jgi:hypothetical protein